MNNIQEYFSPVGSSNSLYFVPNQIDTNEYLGCDTFYIVGLVEPVINQYSLFGKSKKVKISDLHNQNKCLNIKFLIIRKTEGKNNHLDTIDDFLKDVSPSSNIIIDEVGFFAKSSLQLERIKKHAKKCMFLTLIGQSTKKFYTLK
tara:strand:+ start:214 stop:648 length:435 start_codon:yes stop_codon:yes gene_type:complete